MFTLLHLSSEPQKQEESPEALTFQDITERSIDSVYQTLTMDERLNLLSIHSMQTTDSTAAIDSLPINGMLYEVSETPKGIAEAQKFEDQQIRLVFQNVADSTFVNRAIIGQTGQEKLAYYAQAMELEKIKKSGGNVLLGGFFQTLQNKWSNQKEAFQESPLLSEKYWNQLLQAGADNGIKLGVRDFFFKNQKVEIGDQSNFLAIGLSGNRYYARKGHGVIQLSHEGTIFKDRLSKFNLQSIPAFLRSEMQYEGVIVSEDLSVFPAEKQLFEAMNRVKQGVDIVCLQASFRAEFKAFLQSYFDSKPDELKLRCERVLRLKYELFQGKNKSTHFSDYQKPFEFQTHQAALTWVKNNDNLLPIKNLRDTTSFFTSDEHFSFYKDEIEHYAPAKEFDEASKSFHKIIILDGFGACVDDAIRIATNYRGKGKFVLLTDAASFYAKRTSNFTPFEAIVLTSEETNLDKTLALQSLFGAYPISGKLPFYHTPQFPQGAGLDIKSLDRLRYVAPEYLGISEEYISEMDQIAQNGVDQRAFPGCQVMFGWDGYVVYQKNFGFQDYNKTRAVHNSTIYDIASISKIAASTVSLMALQGENKFSLYDTLGFIIPEVTGENPMRHIWLKDMMAHQAGLPAWIPFYVKTLRKGQPDAQYYSNIKHQNFTIPVAKNLWMREDYRDTMYTRILSCNLKGKSYEYSDLGYYFVKKIVEKKSGTSLDKFAEDKIYSDLGLQTMTFNPYLKFKLERIAPTENDKSFRKQLVHGYVHDPGSAMMGGVCGHAGVFSNANDLFVLFQMLLNKGSYGGKEILRKEIIEEYTSVQFPGRNRRGAGFDKPNLDGSAATACSSASPSSFGHSGFTGTLAWADPSYGINFVFLSNRVNPSAENWKITKMNIRTAIQTKVYQSVKAAKNYNFLVSK